MNVGAKHDEKRRNGLGIYKKIVLIKIKVQKPDEKRRNGLDIYKKKVLFYQSEGAKHDEKRRNGLGIYKKIVLIKIKVQKPDEKKKKNGLEVHTKEKFVFYQNEGAKPDEKIINGLEV